MSLLTGGPHTVQIFPEVEGVDTNGDPIRYPSDVPTTIRTRVQNLSSTEASDLGFDPSTTKYFKTRQAVPAGSWARVEFDGRDWDVIGEPQRVETNGAGGLATHTHVVIRARAPQSAPTA